MCDSKNVNANGLDGVFKDGDKFVFPEYKATASRSNVGASVLASAGGEKQLTKAWLDGAVDRTPNLSDAKKFELKNAIRNDNYRTELIVVKTRKHSGVGVTGKLHKHPKFGVNKPDRIGKITIIELGDLKP